MPKEGNGPTRIRGITIQPVHKENLIPYAYRKEASSLLFKEEKQALPYTERRQSLPNARKFTNYETTKKLQRSFLQQINKGLNACKVKSKCSI